MSARESVIVDFTTLLLDTLGYTDGEFVSLGYEDTNTNVPFRTAVMSPTDAVAAAPKLPATADNYFGVNPVIGPARKSAGRRPSARAVRRRVGAHHRPVRGIA
jgi:hypothetical protein